jgi:3-oxoacyl-[acyl-carrier protein] reductase
MLTTVSRSERDTQNWEGKRMGVLDGKVALVTGASMGIGAGIAKLLAAAGAFVVVNYASSKEGADRVVSEIAERGGKAFAAQGDVSKPDDVKQLFEDVVREFGGLDVLVNNAGVYSFGPLESVTEAESLRQYNTNVLGTLLATQEAVKLFGEKGGSIINIGTAGTRNPGPAMVLYLSAKGLIDIITQVLANELGPKKIRVTCSA